MQTAQRNPKRSLRNRAHARGAIVRTDRHQLCAKLSTKCRPKHHPMQRSCTRLGIISKDPIGFAAGDANLYRYVGNGPTIQVDPSGLEGDTPSLSQAPPWYKQWWYNLKGRLANRESLISDPRASTTFQVGDRTYVAANSANAGTGYWIVGNLYHRTPIGGVCDTGLRLATSPIDETSAIAGDIYDGVTNIHKLPETWEQLPDYQKQDIGINLLLSSGAGVGLAGKIPTPKPLHGVRDWWRRGIENDARWRQLPLREKAYYELGQKTLLGDRYLPFDGLDPVAKGRALVQRDGWMRTLVPEGRGWCLGTGATLSTGPTPLIRYATPRILIGSGVTGGGLYIYDNVRDDVQPPLQIQIK